MRIQARFLLLLLCLLVLCEPARSQPPTVNLRPRTTASQSGIPPVRVTVDRRRVPLGTQVTFTLSPASIASDSRYVVTLYFGDDRPPEVMRQPQISHLYRRVGTYTYAVDVKHNGPNPPDPYKPSPDKPGVTLSASPAPAKSGETIKFSAQLSGPYPNIQYRFVYGDGSSSAWQSSPQTQHSYARAGDYSAFVDISDSKSRIGGSPRKQIQVRSDEKLSASLTATPIPARRGKPVTFSARASPAAAGTRYRFNFGDGTGTLWQSDSLAQHAYASSGRYRAFVQVQTLNAQNTAVSPALSIRSVSDQTPGPDPRQTPTPDSSPAPTPDASPTPDGSPTPTPDASPMPTGSNGTNSNGTNSNGTNSTGTNETSSTSGSANSLGNWSRSTWWYLLIAALILFLLYQASGLLFAAQPTFVPFADAGAAAVAHEKGLLPIDFQMVLEPNVAGADYSVTTSEARLVTNAPEPEDRQTFEI